MIYDAAASANVGTEIQQTLLQQGVLGIAVLALAYFAWFAYRREAQRADELEKRLHDLNEFIRTEYVPAMTRATDVIARFIDGLSSATQRGKAGG